MQSRVTMRTIQPSSLCLTETEHWTETSKSRRNPLNERTKQIRNRKSVEHHTRMREQHYVKFNLFLNSRRT